MAPASADCYCCLYSEPEPIWFGTEPPFPEICPKILGIWIRTLGSWDFEPKSQELALALSGQNWDLARKCHFCHFSRISTHYFPSEDNRQQPTDGDDHEGPHPKQAGGEMRTNEKGARLGTSRYERRLLTPSPTAVPKGTAKLQKKWG